MVTYNFFLKERLYREVGSGSYILDYCSQEHYKQFPRQRKIIAV